MRFLILLCLPLLCLPQIAAAQTWLIGEITPLTGPAATVGTRLTKVVRMWAEDVNARGGIAGAKIEILTCNEENRPEKAAACARDLLDKGVVLILGNSLTASIRAIQPLVRQGPVMLIPSRTPSRIARLIVA